MKLYTGMHLRRAPPSRCNGVVDELSTTGLFDAASSGSGIDCAAAAVPTNVLGSRTGPNEQWRPGRVVSDSEGTTAPGHFVSLSVDDGAAPRPSQFVIE